MFLRRGRSEEPELSSHRAPIRLQTDIGNVAPPSWIATHPRARSVGPPSTSATRPPPRYGERPPSAANKDDLQGARALINRYVDPKKEFPSLRRGIPLSQQFPARPNVDNAILDPTKDGDAFAYYFWSFFLFLTAASLLNLILNVAIVHSYGLTATFGMLGMEMYEQTNTVHFPGGLHLDKVRVEGGAIVSFDKENPLKIESRDDQHIVLRVVSQPGVDSGDEPELRVTSESVEIKNIDTMRLVDPETGELYFDLADPESQRRLLRGIELNTLTVDEISADEVSAPLGKSLFVKSDSYLSLVGGDAVSVEGREVMLEASNGDLTLAAEHSIQLDAGELQIDPRALPLSGGGRYPGETGQFKLCVCMPSGLLFRVKSPMSLPEGVEGPQPRVASCVDHSEWEVHPCNTKQEVKED